MRVLFLGTPEFALPTLRTLLKPPFEVVGVVTQPDRPAGRDLKLKPSAVKLLAQESGIAVFAPEKITAAEVEAFKNLKPDIAVVVAFGQILRREFLEAFEHGAVNVHASLLPRWRGAGPIQWSLLADDPLTGVALQRMVQKLDAGAVIGVKEHAITDADDAPKLYQGLSELGAALVREKLPEYALGRILPVAQDETQVTLAPKIQKSQGLIHWVRSAREIFSQWRALKPWPGSWTVHENKMLKVISMKPVARGDDQEACEPGRVLDVSGESMVVGCGKGRIEILQVQPESRSIMKVQDYVRGKSLQKGDRLG